MSFFRIYYNNIVSELLLNRFYYIDNSLNIPKLNKIILSFKYENPSEKQIMKSLLILEILSGCKAKIILRKKSNLKFKSSQLLGCKVILRNLDTLKILSKILFIKNSTKFKKKIKKNVLHLNIKSLHFMPEFENQYFLLNNLSNLNITLVFKNNSTASDSLLLDSLLKCNL